jgi:hypothetical protein
MNAQKGFSILLGSLLIIIVLGGGVYVFMQNSKQEITQEIVSKDEVEKFNNEDLAIMAYNEGPYRIKAKIAPLKDNLSLKVILFSPRVIDKTAMIKQIKAVSPFAQEPAPAPFITCAA